MTNLGIQTYGTFVFSQYFEPAKAKVGPLFSVNTSRCKLFFSQLIIDEALLRLLLCKTNLALVVLPHGLSHGWISLFQHLTTYVLTSILKIIWKQTCFPRINYLPWILMWYPILRLRLLTAIYNVECNLIKFKHVSQPKQKKLNRGKSQTRIGLSNCLHQSHHTELRYVLHDITNFICTVLNKLRTAKSW